MLIEFRQGIYRQQDTRPFMTLTTRGVDINVDDSPTIITLTHGKSDYLFTEDFPQSPAWKAPFPHNKIIWLYWDIDVTTGRRTFDYTDIDPFTNGRGNKLPENPAKGQHYFLLSENKLKYYTGRSWKTVIRVFAGTVTNNAALELFGNGTQIGKNIQTTAGHILFNDDNTPIKKSGLFSSSEFVTTETDFVPQNESNNTYKVENTQINARALEPVPKFHCVSFKGPKLYGVASRLTPECPCIGISVEGLVKDKIGKIVTHGVIRNSGSWNFPDPHGTTLWVGDNGDLTTTVPQQISFQNIGYVISPDTIFLNIKHPITMIKHDEECFAATPTPTPT